MLTPFTVLSHEYFYNFQIVAGAHFLSEDKDGSWQVRFISKLIPHEEYNEFPHANDISLIKLTEPLIFGGPVAPVILPYQDETVEGTNT